MVIRWRRRLSRRQRSRGRFCGQLLTFSLFLLFVYPLFQHFSSTQEREPPQTQPSRPPSPLLSQQAKFWRDLYPLILHNDPKCEYPPELVVPYKVDVGFDPYHSHTRPDILWMRPSDVKRMQVTHANFLSGLRKHPPELVFQRGTRGIVMTAGVRQLPVLVISLRMLRRTGCDLPVEVFLTSPDDYDQQVCELVLPDLSAQCLVLSDIFLAARTGVALEGDQFKIMSLLFSSFEDVLLLDSDTFPTINPISLFGSAPFSTTGMVLWPDFWYPSESPYFFELAQLGTPPPLNARPSIESGEMMFSKSKHNLSLLLAAYYNYHGPQYFYPLLSQGGPGQGDKDTFLWAATVTQSNTSFYLVHEPVAALGHVDSNGIYVGSAMAQHDPIEDIQHLHFDSESEAEAPTPVFGKPDVHPQDNSSLLLPQRTNTSHPTPYFVHANFPKFDPSSIFAYGSEGTARPVFDSNGTVVRAWLPEHRSIAYFGYDVEHAFWEEIQYVACTWENRFTAWKDQKDVCSIVTLYMERVFK